MSLVTIVARSVQSIDPPQSAGKHLYVTVDVSDAQILEAIDALLDVRGADQRARWISQLVETQS